MPRIQIEYFSDVLCVWAYVGERRVAELRATHGDRIDLVYRFIQVFGHVPNKLEANWAHRGGNDAYRDHVLGVAAQFDHVQVHPDIWTKNIPVSSAPAHVMIKAAELVCDAGRCAVGPQAAFDGRSLVEELAWRVRCGFFAELLDVSRRDVLLGLAERVGLPGDALVEHLDDGSALAALCNDQERKALHGVTGSPTWVLNSGRQKLFGNVGYRIIEANVDELLQSGEPGDGGGRLSWC